MTDITNTRIIGIGSPFGADQLGWQIIEQLEQRQLPLLSNEVQLQACDRPGTLLLEYFNKADTAIVIDAIEGGVADNIRLVNKTQLMDAHKLQSSHQLGVAETIALGEQLDLLPDNLFLIGIETGATAAQYKPATNSLEKITDKVVETLNEILDTSKPSTFQ